MNWYKKAQEKTQIMYHNTPANLIPQILQQGLKINSPYVKSQASQWFIPEAYETRPIFLSLTPNLFKEEGDVTLSVDITGLPLVADIPSLTHYGAHYSDAKEGIWFEEGKTPAALQEYDYDGTLYYEDLLDPNFSLAQTCIQLTKSAACLQDIPPQRIKT